MCRVSRYGIAYTLGSLAAAPSSCVQRVLSRLVVPLCAGQVSGAPSVRRLKLITSARTDLLSLQRLPSPAPPETCAVGAVPLPLCCYVGSPPMHPRNPGQAARAASQSGPSVGFQSEILALNSHVRPSSSCRQGSSPGQRAPGRQCAQVSASVSRQRNDIGNRITQPCCAKYKNFGISNF